MDQPKLNVRIDLPNGERFGPGKAALLSALLRQRTIRGAADALNMSYPRALKLIEQMNRAFRAPVIETRHGGSAGGGSTVTALGRQVLSKYQAIVETAQKSNADALGQLMDDLAD